MYRLLICVVMVTAAGCALNRGVIDLESPESAGTDLGVGAPAVYFARITDDRTFEMKPSKPSTPSLQDGQIHNTAITSRAVARKRNGMGLAFGDLLLPEDKTVVDLVRANLTTAFSESGYRVVDAPEPQAVPLDVSITQFWAWVTPNFWTVKMEFRSQLAFTSGSIGGLADGDVVEGYATQNHGAGTDGAWLETMGLGLEDLRTNLKNRLHAADTR